MSNQHWSDEDQLAHLYGVGPQDQHLKECATCAMRSKQLQHRRSQLIGSQPEVPAAFLAGQRQKIQERLAEKRQSFALRPIPAAAMALLLVAVMLWFRPATKPTAVAEISDAELFQKVYAEVYASQPRAVEPLQSLFEKNQ